MKKRLSEQDIKNKKAEIAELTKAYYSITDIKRQIFIKATINILTREIETGFGIVH